MLRRRFSESAIVQDVLNGLLTAVYQVSLALVPFYAFLCFWREAAIWLAVTAGLTVILYFTWYRNLPPKSEVAEPPAGSSA